MKNNFSLESKSYPWMFFSQWSQRGYLPIKTPFEKNRIYQETEIITFRFNKEELYENFNPYSFIIENLKWYYFDFLFLITNVFCFHLFHIMIFFYRHEKNAITMCFTVQVFFVYTCINIKKKIHIVFDSD